MGVKEFSLHLNSKSTCGYYLSSVIFEAESLQYLSLNRCNLGKMAPDKQVLFKHLKTLYLSSVHIEDETFHKIISSCPLIEDMELYSCKGLRTVKVINQKLHNLNYFAVTHYKSYGQEDDDNSIEINVPTLETVVIGGSTNWFIHDHMFHNLKSLDLNGVQLSSKLFDKFSSNFPILEELTISYCSGFEEFKLPSHLIKYFSLMYMGKSIELAGIIDAPNILSFKLSAVSPPSIFFASNSSVSVDFRVDSDDEASSWFRKLNEMLKALCQSEISQFDRKDPPQELLDNINGEGGFSKSPLLMEKFSLSSDSTSSSAAILNGLFRIYVETTTNSIWRK